jgi:hypothetical protein
MNDACLEPVETSISMHDHFFAFHELYFFFVKVCGLFLYYRVVLYV